MPDKKPIKTAIITWNQASGKIGNIEEACEQLFEGAQLNNADVIVFHYQEESDQAELAASRLLSRRLSGHELKGNEYFQTRKNKYNPFRLAHVGTIVLARKKLGVDLKFKEIDRLQEAEKLFKDKNFGGVMSRLNVGNARLNLTSCHLASHDKSLRKKHLHAFHAKHFGGMEIVEYEQLEENLADMTITSGDFNERPQVEEAKSTNSGLTGDSPNNPQSNPASLLTEEVLEVLRRKPTHSQKGDTSSEASSSSSNSRLTYLDKDIEFRAENLVEHASTTARQRRGSGNTQKGGWLDGHRVSTLDSADDFSDDDCDQQSIHPVGGSDHAAVVSWFEIDSENGHVKRSQQDSPKRDSGVTIELPPDHDDTMAGDESKHEDGSAKKPKKPIENTTQRRLQNHVRIIKSNNQLFNHSLDPNQMMLIYNIDNLLRNMRFELTERLVSDSRHPVHEAVKNAFNDFERLLNPTEFNKPDIELNDVIGQMFKVINNTIDKMLIHPAFTTHRKTPGLFQKFHPTERVKTLERAKTLFSDLSEKLQEQVKNTTTPIFRNQ